MTADHLLTINEAAEFLRVSPAQIRKWIEHGQLRRCTINERLVRVRLSAIAELIDDHALEYAPSRT